MLYDDVLYRDIVTRHQIVEVGALKELAFYLVSNPTNLVSFNKLNERLKLGSVNTGKNYNEGENQDRGQRYLYEFVPSR